ncbi:MAG: hypothetical protein ACFE0I_20040 [Elainellaceae cyanobacterium]
MQQDRNPRAIAIRYYVCLYVVRSQFNVSHRNSKIIDNIHISSLDHSMLLYDNGMVVDNNPSVTAAIVYGLV